MGHPGMQPRWRMSTGVVVTGVALVALIAAAALRDRSPAAAQQGTLGHRDSTLPRPIAGGRYEASGLAHVPGTNQLLFVDDGRPSDVFLIELGSDGTQKGVAVSVPLAAEVTDMEGVTSDGQHFYVVGSQSKKKGVGGDGLVRFTFDPATRRADRVERIGNLKDWLADNVPELRGTRGRTGDDVLNVEGLAWDPSGGRLLLGLRAPVVDGAALVIPVAFRDSGGTFTRENLRVDGAAIRVPLRGAGIRGLEYDPLTKTFHVIAGAALNDESSEFRVLEWDAKAGTQPREQSAFPRSLKPEGIARATLEGRSARVIVFDVGQYVVE